MMLIVLAETGKSELDRQDKRLEELEIFEMQGTSAGEIWAGADVVNARDVIVRSLCNRQDGQGHAKEGLTRYDIALPEIEHHNGNRILHKTRSSSEMVNWAPIVLSMRHYCLGLGINTCRSELTYRK